MLRRQPKKASREVPNFLLKPETYQLGTLKGKRNVESVRSLEEEPAKTQENYRKVIEDIFLSGKNTYRLIYLLDRYARNEGAHKTNLEVLEKIVRRERAIFMSDVGVPSPVEYQATGMINYVMILNTMNQMVLRKCRKYVANQLMPSRGFVQGDFPGGKKKMSELLVSDYGLLKFGEPDEVYSMDSMYRENNKIPVEQWSKHTRHLDRDNEGLRERDPGRASLETPVRVQADYSAFIETSPWVDAGLF
jgi:hypothetical protein